MTLGWFKMGGGHAKRVRKHVGGDGGVNPYKRKEVCDGWFARFPDASESELNRETRRTLRRAR